MGFDTQVEQTFKKNWRITK